jgi:hypothetical protein
MDTDKKNLVKISWMEPDLIRVYLCPSVVETKNKPPAAPE